MRRANEDLANGLGNVTNRIRALVARRGDGANPTCDELAIPAVTGLAGHVDAAIGRLRPSLGDRADARGGRRAEPRPGADEALAARRRPTDAAAGAELDALLAQYLELGAPDRCRGGADRARTVGAAARRARPARPPRARSSPGWTSPARRGGADAETGAAWVWPGNASIAGSTAVVSMRATERQRGSGQQLRRQFMAWPGNAGVTGSTAVVSVRATERQRGSGQQRHLRGRGTQFTIGPGCRRECASDRAPARERSAAACVAGERGCCGFDCRRERASDRAPARERSAAACVAGERRCRLAVCSNCIERSRTMATTQQ